MVLRRQKPSVNGVEPASVETASPYAVQAWKKWAEQAIGGPPARVRVACAVALRAAELGHDQAHVIAYAKYAASRWRENTTEEFYARSVPPPVAVAERREPATGAPHKGPSGKPRQSVETEDVLKASVKTRLSLFRVIDVQQRLVPQNGWKRTLPRHRLDLRLQPFPPAPSAEILKAYMEGEEFVGSLMPGDYLGIDIGESSNDELKSVRNFTTKSWVKSFRELAHKISTVSDSADLFRGSVSAVQKHIEYAYKYGSALGATRQTHVLNFRIQTGVESDIAHFLQVETIGTDLPSGISAGNVVEFRADLTTEIARPTLIQNLTTGLDVTRRR